MFSLKLHHGKNEDLGFVGLSVFNWFRFLLKSTNWLYFTVLAREFIKLSSLLLCIFSETTVKDSMFSADFILLVEVVHIEHIQNVGYGFFPNDPFYITFKSYLHVLHPAITIVLQS